MATTEQIELIIRKMQQAVPADFFNYINETQSGMMAVLGLLHTSDSDVTAGKVSQVLNVSTARVAALLKKMTAKGLITKEKDILDGRVTLVKLTEPGKETVLRLQEAMYEQIGSVIDAVGEEKLFALVEISTEIKAVLDQQNPVGPWLWRSIL